MCLRMIQKPQLRGRPDPQGLSSHWGWGVPPSIYELYSILRKQLAKREFI